MTSDLSAIANADGAGRHASLDGNAAVGEFAGIFTADPSSVTVCCGSCGVTQAFAQLRAYLGGPGAVLRCRACEAIVARVARTPRGTWFDIRGSTSWLFPHAPELEEHLNGARHD
jgi:hypothetical protein